MSLKKMQFKRRKQKNTDIFSQSKYFKKIFLYYFSKINISKQRFRKQYCL